MKINSVEQLLESILMVQENDLLEVDGWLEKSRLIENLIRNMFLYFTVEVEKFYNTESPLYVQVAKAENGDLILEAVSNTYCNPPLSMDVLNTMAELGWHSPIPEEDLPNFFILVSQDDINYPKIAEFLVATLRAGYSVQSADALRISPRTLRVIQRQTTRDQDEI
jgi:hypothetical protein